MTLASIIIINYNTAKLSIQAIESIEKRVSSLENFEIILVDNASEISDFNELKLGIEALNNTNLKLIRSKFNLGFGGGNMLGVQNAIGKFYIFMNSDVILTEDSLTAMIDFLSNNPTVSIVGCQAINQEGKKFKGFDYGLSLANELFSDSFLQFVNHKKYKSRIVETKDPLIVDSVAGSLFTCVAKDFDAVGGFDTNLFLYYEEKDLAFRIKKYLNKDTCLLPSTEYIHLQGQSTQTSQKIRNELKISQFYAIQKNLGTIKFYIFYLLNLIIFLLKSPFNKKNRAYLFLLLNGISTSKSIKHHQKKNKTMTILHVSAVKNWGGGENHIETLCYELMQSNPEVNNIVLCVKDKPFHDRLKETDIEYETAPLAYNLDFRFSLKIISLCKKHKVDVIHIHDPSAIALTIIADKLSKLPPFVFSKKTSFPIKSKKLTLYKYNYPKIKKYFCVSDETKRICEKSIYDKNKLITIYHGTSLLNKSSETSYLLRDKFKIDPSKKIIGNIGNHIRAKNLETFIETLNSIINIKKRTDFFFIQIGTFTDRTENLINKIKELNLENHIIFLGYTPNASNFIPQFDAFLMTSQSEGIPEVLFESFYHKTPVVSTDVGGIPEIIEDGINGLLTPKHNPELLSEKIIYLFENETLIDQFTTISHEKLMKNFVASTMAKKMLQEYQNVAFDYHKKN